MTPVIALFLAPFTLLTLCYVVELFAGLRPLPPGIESPFDPPLRTVIVVPAHNEEAVLPVRLKQLQQEAPPGTSILLVADNCTDGTASIGRGIGVEVIERRDPAKRGKGFALNFAREHLNACPPDVVLIVDADCAIDRESIIGLAKACNATGRPCQATNLQKPAPDGSPAVQISTFAFFIKNVVRQRGLQRLIGGVNLLGTGMAFPWPIFEQAELATSSIVEDLMLGQHLAASGHAPLLIEHATVWSSAETAANTLAQRRRWEGGFLHHALRAGPGLLGKSILDRDPRGVWRGLDVLIPPLALLIAMDVGAVALATVFTVLTRAHWWGVELLAGAVLIALTGLGLAWRSGGSQFISGAGLCRVPLYVAWKIPMYLGFLRRGAPKEWQRTQRR